MPRRGKRLRDYSINYLRRFKIGCRSSSNDSSSCSSDNSNSSNDLPVRDESSTTESINIQENSTSESSSSLSELLEVRNDLDDDLDDNSDVDLDHEMDEAIFYEAIDSDSSENSDEDLRYMNEVLDGKNEPLYEGAPLTVGEHLIAIMSMIVRHSLNLQVQEDLLKLVALHCLPRNKCKTTLYMFNKEFEKSKIPMIRNHYCSECFEPVANAQMICPTCEGSSKIDYFIEPSITSQLKILYKRRGFLESLQQNLNDRCENNEQYTDIHDGVVYKDLRQYYSFNEDPTNITFMMYTDGVRIFNSSKFNVWPIYFAINELPFSMRFRQENIVLAALWFGEEKPFPNLFLKPLIESAEVLREGVQVEDPEGNNLLVKGVVQSFVADLPAKALMYYMNQYNGRFGCQTCTLKGEQLPNTRIRVYPYEPIELRTDEGTCLHAQQAFDSGIKVCGVKGPTALRHIIHQFIRGLGIDLMHCGMEGLVDNILNFLFSSDFSDHPASIINKMKIVDERIGSVRPPSFVQRLLRSIKDHLKYWKGHEKKLWLFVYSVPCLMGLMKDEYFEHYLLLVLGISLLSKTVVSARDLDLGSRAIDEFVSRFQELYGLRYMISNLHQLRHLPEMVRRFGPLWTTSCFPFEDLNGKLKKFVHGSNFAQLQICTATSKFVNMATLKNEYLRVGGAAERFCTTLSSKFGRMKRFRIGEMTYIIGKLLKVYNLPRETAEIFHQQNIVNTRYFTYKRLLKDKTLYSSVAYLHDQKTDSSFVLYSAEDGSSKIGRIHYFVRTTDCDCHNPCECLAGNYAIIQPCITENRITSRILNVSLSNFHNIVDYEDNKVAVDISCLKSVCFHMKFKDVPSEYIVEKVNCMEFE